jgi:hypothetical protein
MAYRDDVTALAARHAALADEVARKTRELEQSRQLLEQARERQEATSVLADCAPRSARDGRSRWIAAGAAALIAGGLGAAAVRHQLRAPEMMKLDLPAAHAPSSLPPALTPPEPTLTLPGTPGPLTQPKTPPRPPRRLHRDIVQPASDGVWFAPGN